MFSMLLFALISYLGVHGLIIDASDYNMILIDGHSTGEQRFYYLYVPVSWRTYTDPVSLPLIMAMHGMDQHATGGNYYMGFPPISDLTDEFIVVFPEGDCEGTHTQCEWELGDGTLDDIAFLDTLINFLATTPIVNEVTIDLQNVFVTGHSQGGYNTYRYMRENNLPHGIRAAAPYAGHDNRWNPSTPTGPTNLIHIHGDSDPIVPIEGTIGSYKWSIEYWLDYNNCPSTDYTVKELHYDLHNGQDYAVRLEKFSNVNPCPPGQNVWGMVWIGMNHDWPGISTWPPNGESQTGFTTGSTKFAHLIWMQMKEIAEVDCIPRCLHGDCVGGMCKNCDSGWIGDYCSKPDTNLCQPACGTNQYCHAQNDCRCTAGWEGTNCLSPVCNPECQNGGTCSSPNSCTCPVEWDGPICADPVCDEFCPTGIDVHGSCTEPGVCLCDTGYITNPDTNMKCDIEGCFDIPKDDPLVCSGNGACSLGVCTCSSDEWIGEQCQYPVIPGLVCFGIASESTNEVCSGNGACTKKDTCSCFEGFTGSECENLITCGDYDWDDVNVCSKHGDCVEIDKCVCHAGWGGAECANENSGKPPKKSTSSTTGVAVGIGVSIGSLLLLGIIVVWVVVAVFVVVYLRRRKNENAQFDTVKEMDSDEDESEEEVRKPRKVQRKLPVAPKRRLPQPQQGGDRTRRPPPRGNSNFSQQNRRMPPPRGDSSRARPPPPPRNGRW